MFSGVCGKEVAGDKRVDMTAMVQGKGNIRD